MFSLLIITPDVKYGKNITDLDLSDHVNHVTMLGVHITTLFNGYFCGVYFYWFKQFIKSLRTRLKGGK